MATVWNGKEMVVVSEDEARRMEAEDLGTWLEKHNGSALKYRHQFTGYQNKAMTTSTAATASKAAAKKKPAKKKA